MSFDLCCWLQSKLCKKKEQRENVGHTLKMMKKMFGHVTQYIGENIQEQFILLKILFTKGFKGSVSSSIMHHTSASHRRPTHRPYTLGEEVTKHQQLIYGSRWLQRLQELTPKKRKKKKKCTFPSFPFFSTIHTIFLMKKINKALIMTLPCQFSVNQCQ